MWKFPKYDIGSAIDWEEMLETYSWIQDMQGVEQDPEWHAEGDVFTHTKMVCEELIALEEFQSLSDQDKHILVTSALLHDVEKRSTTSTEIINGKERIVSPRHAKKGEFTARKILYTELDCPFEIREQICKLVRLHGLPLWAISKTNPQKEVVYASLVVNTAHLAMLAKADVLGRYCNDKDEILLRIELFKELCSENNCLGKPKEFKSSLGRYQYFNKKEAYVDFEPFDDTICTVTMMCALPGSGKDTYIKNNLNIDVLSLDEIRRTHKVSPTDKKKNGQVIQLAKEKAKEFLRAKKPFVFNATNISSEIRSKWISIFTEYNAKVEIVYIEVPYKTLLKQNHNRDHKVPEKVLASLLHKFEMPTLKEVHNIKYVV